MQAIEHRNGRPITLSPGTLVEAHLYLGCCGDDDYLEGDFEGVVDAIVKDHAVFTITGGVDDKGIGRVVSVPLCDVRALCEAAEDAEQPEPTPAGAADFEVVLGMEAITFNMRDQEAKIVGVYPQGVAMEGSDGTIEFVGWSDVRVKPKTPSRDSFTDDQRYIGMALDAIETFEQNESITLVKDPDGRAIYAELLPALQRAARRLAGLPVEGGEDAAA